MLLFCFKLNTAYCAAPKLCLFIINYHPQD